MSKQPVIFTQNISESIDEILSRYSYDKLFVLTVFVGWEVFLW